MKKKKVLILGASGMLGHMLFYSLPKEKNFDTYGAVRRLSDTPQLSRLSEGVILDGVHFDSDEPILSVLASCKPDLIINCVGMIRQQPNGNNHLACIDLNSRLPHRLYKFAQVVGARFIHISTDCVFNGSQGFYSEEDSPTADDVYGMSKYLGEVTYGNALTIRTSIIGPELRGKLSLLEWFLSQSGSIRGYENAIYSGLPTFELSQIIKDIILKHENLNGLYHVASNPISKYDLLKMIAERYSKEIEINKYSEYKTDKSLSWQKFASATGYHPKSWEVLIDEMYANDTNRGFRT